MSISAEPQRAGATLRCIGRGLSLLLDQLMNRGTFEVLACRLCYSDRRIEVWPGKVALAFFHPGCFSVAPLWPQTEQRAQRRKVCRTIYCDLGSPLLQRNLDS